jgi:hypothetical protein
MCEQEVMIFKKFNLTKNSFVKVLADFFGLHIGEIFGKKNNIVWTDSQTFLGCSTLDLHPTS